MRFLILSTIFLVSCGHAIERRGKLSQNIKDEITLKAAETARWVTWCDDYPSAENCNDGDGLATTLGFLCSISFDPACNAVSRSVREDGQILRAPGRQDTSNTASRDQFLGFMVAQSSGERKWLDAKRFIKKHGVVCTDDTDGRCDLTPVVWALIGATHKHLGYTRDLTMAFNGLLLGKMLLAQSIAVPTGYQLNLVVNAAHIAYLTGMETDLTYTAAYNAYLRQQANPWFCYVVFGADDECAQLALETWPTEPERKDDWSIQRDTAEQAHRWSQGWEYLFMAALFGVDLNLLEYHGKRHSKVYPQSH